MSEIKLTALILLSPDGDRSILDRVNQVCTDCLDLADVKVDRPATGDVPDDNRWIDIQGKLEVADFIMAEVSPLPGHPALPLELMVQLTYARYACNKPVLLLMHGDPPLPLGWHAHPDTFKYEASDEGYTALMKAVNRRLVTLVTEVEQRLIAGDAPVGVGGLTASAAGAAVPAGVRASAAGAPVPAGVAMPSEEEDARIKAVLRERFRRRLDGDVDSAALAAKKAEEALLKQEEERRAAQRAALAEMDPAAAAAAEEGAAKRSRMLELQEKMKRNEAQAKAAKAAPAGELKDDLEDDLGFDLDIDIGGGAAKASHGLSSKVRSGEISAEQVRANSSTDDDDEDEDEDFELNASDIDILKDIRGEGKKKKKKKKRPNSQPPSSSVTGSRAGAPVPKSASSGVTGSRPGAPVPGGLTGSKAGAQVPAGVRASAAGAPVPAAAAGANRKGLATLTDKRSGRKLELRKDELSIGRIAGNDVILPDGQISSRHCKIIRKDNAYFIIDLGSTNGTFVNDTLVSTKQAQRLNNEDRVVVARTKELPNGAREFVFHQEV
ncbi:MAG: FHA domain-containing protein [Planctomycetota bacterium]